MCTNIDLYTHIKIYIDIQIIYIHPISMLVYPYLSSTGREEMLRQVTGDVASLEAELNHHKVTSEEVRHDRWRFP